LVEPVPVEVDELVNRFPLLFHMAEEGSWSNICRHGLLSTSTLLDLYGVGHKLRTEVEAQHRPENVVLNHGTLPTAIVRDQKPLNMARLESCLTDMTGSEWLQHLNRRVFFWTSERRLLRLLKARPYKALAHDVLTVETASLVASHSERITLAPYNTGATMPTAVARGSDTFRMIADYPFAEWRSKRPTWDAVVELAVDQGVDDIATHVVRVERRRGEQTLATIWQR
jgi:hypothetical protein